jgi:hypothetical protein
MFRIMTALAFAALLSIGALTTTASAWTNCTTNCNSYGNQTSCTRTCF